MVITRTFSRQIQVDLLRHGGTGKRSACSKQLRICLHLIPSGPWGVTNFAVNPLDSEEMIISSSTGNIFSTSNDGDTWFDIGQPSVFGSPGSASIALAYGAP